MSASPTLAATIAAYVARSGSQPLRKSTRQAAKAVLLHNLAVGLAAHGRPLPGLSCGRGLPWAQRPMTAPDLAFATSLQMGARAQHDEHPSSVTHLGSTVIPACLAIAPAGIDGARLLSAIAVGYQVGGVLGNALLPYIRARGMRATGVVGPIAAAAAAAAVQELDETAIAQAISLAVNRAAGYTQVWHSGTDEWRLQTAAAARDGLESALWAAGGARGADAALEGASGLLHALGADGMEAAELAEALAGPPVIEHMLLKAHPVCAINQAAVEVAIDLRELAAIEAQQIVSVTVRLAEADAVYPGIDVAWPPTSWSQAMMDVRQAVAVALAEGRVDIDALYPASAEAQRVRERVSVVGGMPGGAGHGAEIVIELADGRRLEGRAESVEVDGERSAQMAAELLPAVGISVALAVHLPGFVDAIDEPDGVGRLVAAMEGIEPWASLCSR
ncbi:MmgE/PrpD family protein [Cryobacterium sp. M15]|uniref:MmgE/PrpD family protein n=1 Tax=Cryobacterium sp. M15 TaxID=2048291 RepID=UPI001304D07A|nr:MmgE/PrpD family protein [Cryobacterium sp. M15]